MDYQIFILAVDQEYNTIMVQYSSEGYKTRTVNLSVPLSLDLEVGLQSYLEMNAPLGEWQNEVEMRDISSIKVGITQTATINKADAIPLEVFKANRKRELDNLATNIRLEFISENKDATYLNKSLEVDRYVADGQPTEISGLYPYIETEASLTNRPLQTVAASIIAARDLWAVIDPQIEGLTLAGKAAISKLTDRDEIRAQYDATFADLYEVVNAQ